MPAKTRFKTKYPGVFYIESPARGRTGTEKVFYILYRRDGRQIEEKVGRQYADDMTEARAAAIRGRRIEGEQSNEGRREEERARKAAEAGRWTFSKLWAEYKAHREMNKSLHIDDLRFEKYLSFDIGDKEPKDLLPLDVDRIRLRLLKIVSRQTVKHVLGLLKRCILFGVKKGLCDGIRFKIEMPHVDNMVTEDLTPEQLQSLLRAIDEDENRDVASMMKLALYTGMRRGELFKLQWRDIDFLRGHILIRDPKGKRDQRIPLNDAARDIFEAVPRVSDFVFPGKDGGQRASLQKASRRIRERAGLPKDFRPMHGLRHAYASMLASSGQVDLYTIQKLLTHKDPRMTQRYAHLRDEALQRAAALAGDIITQAAGEPGAKAAKLKK